jgi:hypothetical protein
MAKQRCHVLGAVSGADLGGVLAEGGVPDEVEPVFYLSSRMHLWDVAVGFVGEAGVDAGLASSCSFEPAV